MKTLIPAVWHKAIAGFTEGLGGSIRDINPTNVSPSNGKLDGFASASKLKSLVNLAGNSS